MLNLTATIYQNGKRIIITIPAKVTPDQTNILTVTRLLKGKSCPS